MAAVQTLDRTTVFLDGEPLASVEGLAPRGHLVTVQIGKGERGRVTGWWVGCTEHGVMPRLAPSKTLAGFAALKHLELEHHGTGRIEVKG